MCRFSLNSITGVKFTFSQWRHKAHRQNCFSKLDQSLKQCAHQRAKRNTTIAPFLIIGNFCVNCSLLRMKNGLFVSTVQVGKLLTLIDLWKQQQQQQQQQQQHQSRSVISGRLITRGEQALFNLEIKKKRRSSIDLDIHQSKVFSSAHFL